jgi:plastocyanin
MVNINKVKVSAILLPLLILTALTLPALAQSAGVPQVTITSPMNGSNVSAGNVTVSVKVMNFNLVPKLGQANVPGEGHLHYYIDVQVPKTPGKPAVTAVGTFVPTINTSYTWQNVMPGRHNFSVQLANNDHTPLIPLVYETINVTATNATLKTMSANSVTVGLTAQNTKFNTSTITVPAGANVTVNFNNMDSGVPHNLAVYTDSSAANKIFIGQIITGPKTTTYTFTAPSKPGTYYFRCDVHPTTMYGNFIVK